MPNRLAGEALRSTTVSDLSMTHLRVLEEIKASGGTAAREFGDQNIHVNAIVPGLTISEGVDNHPQLGVARNLLWRVGF